jgi:Flp pilus assembly protein TadD
VAEACLHHLVRNHRGPARRSDSRAQSGVCVAAWSRGDGIGALADGIARALVGTQLAVAGRHSDAIAELRQAAPEYPLARYHLGGELFNQGASDEAAVQLQEFVRLEPLLAEAVPARTMIGRAQMLGLKFPEAIDQFRRVMAMTRPGDEANTTALGFLADALFSDHRLGDAVGEYRAYLARRPRDVGAFINLGVSLAQIGKPAEAAEAFQRAIQLDPANVMARRNLAILVDESR